MGVPKNGWFIMEKKHLKLLKIVQMDDLGVPPGNSNICMIIVAYYCPYQETHRIFKKYS
jgi:hypothetical protein